MLGFAAFLLAASLLPAASPFAGRWNFTIKTPKATRAIWLGITPAGNSYDVWFQPTGGHVYRLEQVAVEGGKLLFNLNRANAKGPRQTIELTRSGGALTGVWRRGDDETTLTANLPERRIGSVYGRIAPKVDLPRNPGAWETFEITLIGRTLTVVRNGVTTIDRQDIEGPTGGALDGEEDQPGPFYIQGDHTGGIKFRNITVQAPRP
jgi:hypothetical protein